MANVIKLQHTNTSGQTPNTLAKGEVAVNTYNQKIWVGNGTGNTLVFNHASYAPASANASQSWVSSNFSNNAGDITSVAAGTGMSGGGTSGAVTLNCTITDTNTWRGITNSVSTVDGGTSASATAVKTAYDRAWPNTTYTAGTGMSLSGTTFNCNITDTNTWRGISNSVSTVDAGTSASLTGVKAAYDRSWPNTTYSAGTGMSLSGTTFNCTVSTAGLASTSYVTTQINNLIDAAPGALNTLNELAASIGDDASYATTVTNALAGKLGSTAKAADSELLDGKDGAKYLSRTGGGYYLPASWIDFAATNVGLYWSGGLGAGWHIYPSSTQYMRIRTGNTTSGGFQLQTASTTRGYLYWDSSNAVKIKNESGDNRFTVPSSGNLSRDTYAIWDAGNVVGGTGISVSGQTITNTVTNTWRSIGDSVSTTSSSVSASQTAVKAAYDRSWPNTTYSEGDHGLTQANFTDALRTKLNGIAASATNTAAPHYTSAIAVGDGGLTQKNFTTTLKSKLDGIAASANNYSFPHTVSSSAGNSTVVQRTGSGYIFANYFNTSPNTITTNVITKIVAESADDGYMRHADAGSVRSFLNVANGATNTAAPHYTSAIAVGAGGLTQQNFTTTLKNKLDGIAAGAQVNTTHTTNTWRSISDSVSTTSSSVSASQTAVKAAYDRSWPNTTYSEGDHGLTQANFTDALRTKLNGIAAGAQVNTTHTTNTWRGISDSVSTTSSSVSASQTAVKAAYDRSWPNTTYSEGDHGLTQANFTDTLRTKLNGIAASANNYSFPYTVSASAGNSTVVQRHSSGYIFSNYINTTADVSTSLGHLSGRNTGDTYHRWYTAATVRTFLNVANGATNVTNNNQLTNGAGYITSYVNTTYSEGDHGLTQANFTDALRTKLNGIAAGAQVNTTHTTNTWRSISDSVSTTSSSVSASQTAVKAAYDRSWPNTTYSEGDHGLTQANFTDALRTKLNGIAAGAQVNTAHVTNTNQLTNGSGYITSSQSTMGSLFGGAASGVTNQGLSRDVAYKIMNNSNSSVACVTTLNGGTNEYLRYASGGNFSWDTIEYNQLQNVSALTALP